MFIIRKKQIDKAILILKNAIKEMPDSEELYWALASAFSKKGENDNAYKVLDEVLKKFKNSHSAMNFVAYFYAEKGIKLKEAETLSKKSLSKLKNDGYYLDTLGWIYFKQGKYEKAKEIILRASKKLPENYEIAEHVADIYYKLKQKDIAFLMYQKALVNIDNNNEDKAKIKAKIKERFPKKNY